MGIFRDERGEIDVGALLLLIPIVLIGLLVVWALFTTSVPAGSVGIQNTFGYVDENVMQPGFHLKGPFTEVIPLSMRTQKYMDYEKTDVATIVALSNEGLSVSMGIAVNYHLDPRYAVELYKQVGPNYQSVIMVNPIHSVPRDLISKYDAKMLYSAAQAGSPDRAIIEKELFDEISSRVNNMGVKNSIVIEDVFIRNIQLPSIVTTAIENVKRMEQESQQKEFEIQKQVKEAQRMREEAQGIADANRIISGSLTQEYLQWYWIESMKTNPKTIYVPSNNGLPIFKDIDQTT